jgi:hypothetical protein
MKLVETFDELVELVFDCRVVMVEGPRCSGKHELIKNIQEQVPAFRYYEYLYPRSDRKSPTELTPEQSTFWVMDFLNQNSDLQVICNRAVVSGLHYASQLDLSLLEIWSQCLRKLGGVVVYLLPDMTDHRRRIIKADRSHELNHIILERRGLAELIDGLEEDLVLTYRG